MKTINELFAMEKLIKDGTAPITKEQFDYEVDEQDGVRVCSHCGDLMTEGYLVCGCDPYCSLSCCDGGGVHTKEIRESIKDNTVYDHDNFFWTKWGDDGHLYLNGLNELLDATQELALMEYKWEQDLYKDGESPTKEYYMELQRKKYRLRMNITVRLVK